MVRRGVPAFCMNSKGIIYEFDSCFKVIFVLLSKSQMQNVSITCTVQTSIITACSAASAQNEETTLKPNENQMIARTFNRDDKKQSSVGVS